MAHLATENLEGGVHMEFMRMFVRLLASPMRIRLRSRPGVVAGDRDDDVEEQVERVINGGGHPQRHAPPENITAPQGDFAQGRMTFQVDAPFDLIHDEGVRAGLRGLGAADWLILLGAAVMLAVLVWLAATGWAS